MPEAGDDLIRRFFTSEFNPPYEPYVEGMGREANAARNRRNRQHDLATRVKAQQELEAAFGLADHPHKEAAWALAWAERHSSGYGEVADFYRQLAELMKP